MEWDFEDALEKLKRTFPSSVVNGAGSGSDCLVGTVKDFVEANHDSFQLPFNGGGRTVSDIQIAHGQELGDLAIPSRSNSARHVVPIQIFRQVQNRLVLGRDGGYEVCVNGDAAIEQSNLWGGE